MPSEEQSAFEASYLAEVKNGTVRPADALRQLLDEFDTAEESIQRIINVCKALRISLGEDDTIRWIVNARFAVVHEKNEAVKADKAAYHAQLKSR